MTYVLVADTREKILLLVSGGSGLYRQVAKYQLKITSGRVEYPYGGHFLY